MDPYIFQRYQIISYVDTACLAAVVWDLLCLLPQEIDLVWKGQWNLVKILYIVLRLLPLASFFAYLIVWDKLRLLLPFLTSRTVSDPLPRSIVVCVNLVFVEAFLGLRVRAIWNGNRAITIVIVVWLISVIASVFTLSFSPYPFFAYLVNYGLFSAFYILMLTLTVIRAKQSMPYHGRTRLLRVVFRDGILYYLIILPLSLAEVIAYSMDATYLVTVILQRMIQFLSSVLAARITISMKAADKRGTSQTLLLSELIFTAQETIAEP